MVRISLPGGILAMQNDSEKEHTATSDSAPKEDKKSIHKEIAVKKIDDEMAQKPQDQVLKSALETVLQEAATDQKAFVFVRDICLISLTKALEDDCIDKEPFASSELAINGEKRRDLPLSSPKFRPESCLLSPQKPQSSETTSAKSPHEKLRSLMPGLLEKEKSGHKFRDDAIPLWMQYLATEDQSSIRNITVIFSGDSVPEGYTKIERTPSGLRADLNRGGRGLFAYLCVSRELDSEKAPISEVLVTYPERGEYAPTDYELVQRRAIPLNLNTGTNGEKVYLYVKRSWTTSITDIKILFPKKGDKIPYGYLIVDKTPDGHSADLNMNSGGTEVVFCYRKRFQNLVRYREAWLHSLGIQSSAHEYFEQIASPVKEPRSMRLDTHSRSEMSSDFDPSVDRYMYPLIIACYWRNGNLAEAAVEAISSCLDAGVFDQDGPLQQNPHLESIAAAISSLCLQGVTSRFAIVLPFFRKIVRKSPDGISAPILHSLLTTLTCVGEFDMSLIKAIDDELVYKIMNRLEQKHCVQYIEKSLPVHVLSQSFSESMRDITLTCIDDIVEGIENAKKMERFFVVFKSHGTINSSRFCDDLCSVMKNSEHSIAEINAFHLIVTLCKSVNRKGLLAGNGVSFSSSHPSTGSTITSPVPINANHSFGEQHSASEREQNACISSLRSLNVALLAAGARTRDDRLFGHLVRRVVFSAINSICLVPSPDVFRANFTLISTLWTHYRRHLKIELALLFENMLLRILRSGSSLAWSYQMEIMHGLVPLFQLPHNVVELFANFDMNRQFVQQWKIFEHCCAVLCSIAEGNSSQSALAENEGVNTALKLQLQAMETISAIARSVMDISGHAHLISRDARTRHLSIVKGGWEPDEGNEDGSGETRPLQEPNDISKIDRVSSADRVGDEIPDVRMRGSRGLKPSASIRMQNEIQKKNQQTLKRAMEIASTKGLCKAIGYLCAMNFLEETPKEISSFLRIYHDFFDEADIGDYLGEGDEDLKVQIRLTYVRAMSFEGMTLVESLRHFLTNGGFRLPGEAQKIERMVDAFAQSYFQDSSGYFSSADTAMILSYSIIMLNTDLHNPQVKKNKMSKVQFIKNNRGIDNGRDFPRRFLEEIYDEILHQPIKIIESRIVLTNSPKPRDVMSMVDLNTEKFRSMLARGVAQSEELMKDLSRTFYTFNFAGIDTSISPDLIKILFERVWFYFLALSTSILSDKQSDLSMIMQCLDLLRFSISSCLFLGMDIERQAFCNILSKLQMSLSPGSETRSRGLFGMEGNEISPSREDLIKQSKLWMSGIESAALDNDPWRVMGDLHILVNRLKDSIQRRQKFELLKSLYKRINRSNFYLKDSTQFLFEGDLIKRCRSRQRHQTYRFFLFNDQLLYADKSISGTWNPHNSLRLKLTRICDIPDSALCKNAFHVINPVKSFIVHAENASVKSEWMRLIEHAIAKLASKTSRSVQKSAEPSDHLDLSISDPEDPRTYASHDSFSQPLVSPISFSNLNVTSKNTFCDDNLTRKGNRQQNFLLQDFEEPLKTMDH
ncbi:unnamed protein product [Albugo candida]|uniref:SEC7 domain-containing protein n=1 Tax=Albugo candida TaxID=65357 RepID=A0A024G0M1_9STRA|nr:unnamed protein product [Albugo candida]|eukprot:CCI40210.1 unnamed protein product [Albugo candida]